MDELPEESAEVVRKVPNIVAILSGESVAGRALELLLQSLGYQTRFLVEPLLDELDVVLDGVKIVILSPTIHDRYREDFLRSIEHMPAMAGKPVLELITSSDSSQPLAQGRVLWPCRMEELQREIETALLIGPKSGTTSDIESDASSTDYDPEDVLNTKTA